MKNTIRMAIAVVAVVILTPARAANLNSVYIDQVGSGSTISITQNGSGNEAGNSTTAMTMNGGAQQINIDQVGSNNTHLHMPEISTKPYLLRAIYEWCTDSGLTPYLSVKVDSNTRVPLEYVKNGEIVLNISFGATSGLKMDNDSIRFHARFGGVSREIFIRQALVEGDYDSRAPFFLHNLKLLEVAVIHFTQVTGPPT